MPIEPWVSLENAPSTSTWPRTRCIAGSSTAVLPAHKIGRLWKFRLSEVDAWVLAQGAENKGGRKAAPKRARRR